MIKKANIFSVINPEWTFGKKVVVLANDYELLWIAYTLQQEVLKKEREKSAEWEKAARLARSQRGLVRVVK